MRLNWTKSKDCWSACLLQSRIVCFNQEERLAGLSEGCPFLKEIKSRIKTLSGLWFDPYSTSEPVQGPVFFEFSIHDGS